MKILLVVVFTAVLLPAGYGADIPDVTTIYDVQNGIEYGLSSINYSAKVYKLTNALGLDLFLDEEKYESDSISKPTLLCDVASTCDWEFTGWTDTFSTAGFGAPIQHGSTYPFSAGFTVKFSRKVLSNDDNHEILLVFTQSNANIRSQSNFYVMNMFDRSDKQSRFYYNCYARDSVATWNITDRDGVPTNLYCNNHHQSWLIYYNSRLKFTSNSGYTRFYANDSTSEMLNIYTGNFMNFVTVYYLQRPNVMRLTTPTPVKKSVMKDSSIVSPTIVPLSKNLCLILVLNCSTDTRSSVLRVSAVDAYQTEHVLYDVNNLKAGWQVKHVNFEITNKISTPIKLAIRKVLPVEVIIARISSCSSQGLEVVKLPQYTADQLESVKFTAPRYMATSDAMPLIEVAANFDASCLNGGVMTTSGCACPPGFTGTNCQTGCGRNKFGQDCGGSCSYRTRECGGYVVCSPFTGCTCPPGYLGLNCTIECPEGWYGNECWQRCAHCAEGETCDIYSGECPSCSFGYLPPYCRQEYVYYSLPPTLVSEKYKTITVSFNLQQGVKGVGEPKLYQIQYSEKGSSVWKTLTIKTVPKAETEESESSTERRQIKETIDDLKVGTWYEVRVLLMDASFNKYDGELVKPAQVLTKCDIPEEFDYKTTSSSNTTAFVFTWEYELENENWCPVEGYEVSWTENGELMTDFVNDPMYTLADFRPGFTIDFKVQAKTSGGFAPDSKTVKISTQHYGTGSVRDLRMISSQSTALEISWRSPLGSEERPLKYKITFKCVSQVACAPGCKDALEGQLTQEGTSVTMSALLPFTQYLVTVTPENGPESKLYVGTTEAAPTEAPLLSSQKSVRSNSSITIFWEPVPVCSSFLKGYTYQLTKASESMKLLASGFTKDTSMSFSNLTASTDYVVKVFINTVAGWNPDAFLAVNLSTSATVPDAVQNLTVYKRGRTMLGLRWTDPKYLYGELKSFKVQYSLGKDVISETVQPRRCDVWPEYYCHTLENLKSNRKYNVMVTARNMEMPEDGAIASLTSITKESAPLPPEDLKVLNSTSTSVSLQWRHPSLINGVLRSFLVNVEESEKYDQDSCCQDYPLVEIQVKDEKRFYEVEVSGLHPASTYYMSVSAKTVSMGPSQSLVVYTRPPHLPISVFPVWSLLTDIVDEFNYMDEQVDWLPQQNLPEVNNSDTFTPLIRAYILLAAQNRTEQVSFSPLEAGIKDEQILSLLEKSISGPFWFITEYKEGSLETDSVWGEKPDAVFNTGLDYELIAVQITDYNNVYNLDMRYSSPFHV